MSFIEDVVTKTLDKMTVEERHTLIVNVVQHMLSQMSAQERNSLMEHIVEHFLDELSPEDKQATVRELVPKLLGQLMKSGNMNVDELLWAAMGSLGALEQQPGPGDTHTSTPREGSRNAVSE